MESVISSTWRHHACTSSSVLWYHSVSMISRKKITVTSVSYPGCWQQIHPNTTMHQISWRTPHKFIIFFYNGNYLVLIQFYHLFSEIIEGNYQNLDIHLILVQNSGTSWSPAGLLNLPICNVYVFSSTSSVIFWTCKMKTQNISCFLKILAIFFLLLDICDHARSQNWIRGEISVLDQALPHLWVFK